MPVFRYDDGVVSAEIFRKVLFGGDFLTQKRAKGAQNAVVNELTPTGQLRGLVPVIEDWHTRQCLMQVCIYMHAI